MTWTGQSFSVGQVLSATQLNNMQADITAIMNQDSGAPAPATDFISLASQIADGIIGQSEIGASAVGQSEIKLNTQVMSITTSSAYTTSFITASGEVYTLGHKHKYNHAQGIEGRADRVRDDGQTSNIAEWRIIAGSSGGASITYTFNLSYISSSPPYDLGDGEIPLFIYVELDSTGNIISTSISPEAPWHYNGPTDITPNCYSKDGTAYRLVKDMNRIPFTLMKAIQSEDMTAIEEYISAFDTADWIEEELTQKIKNADMDKVPLAINNRILRPDNRVIMLDPVSDIAWKILEMRNHGEFNEIEFISRYCDIGNTPLNRAGPKIVDIMGFRMRKTK